MAAALLLPLQAALHSFSFPVNGSFHKLDLTRSFVSISVNCEPT
jgi:hypothetical protein